MQIKKDIVRDRILRAAADDFLDIGFQKASLREIAKKAGVSKGSIYTYFRNKDELFLELAGPAMEHIKATMQMDYDKRYTLSIISNNDDYLEFSVKEFSDFVYTLLEHKEGLRLLFFASAGSQMENFREEVFELYTFHSLEFGRKIEELIPGKTILLSEMLIHSLASMYLRMLEEILIHEPCKEELDRYIEQTAVFVHSGFAKMVNMQI